MIRWPASVVLLLFLSIGVLISPATADPIPILGGSLSTHGGFSGSATIDIQGTRGFRLISSVGDTGGRADYLLCGFGSFCLPGDEISLFAWWLGHDLVGTVQLDGVSYSMGMHTEEQASASAMFMGAVTAPPFNASGTVSVTAPFTFQGTFFFPFAGEPRPPVTLFGLGHATLVLERVSFFPGEPDSWQFQQASYEFAPIPEPATLLLVGTGLAGTVYARRRRRKS